MWRAGVPVSGHQLHIPTCPPTVEEILAAHAAALARWQAAGPTSYRCVIDWGPLRPAPTMYDVTVVEGHTMAVAPARIEGEAPPPPVDQAVLDSVPGTIEEVFARLATEVLGDGAKASYDASFGYPTYVLTGGHTIAIVEFEATR